MTPAHEAFGPARRRGGRLARQTIIAHWIPASVRIPDDAPQRAGMIGTALRHGHGLELREDELVLAGSSSGENPFGLIPQAAAICDRWLPRLEIATKHADVLVRNLAAARAEARLAPALKNPNASIVGGFGDSNETAHRATASRASWRARPCRRRCPRPPTPFA